MKTPKILIFTLFIGAVANLLSGCATSGDYVDPRPQREANQRLQDHQTRRALQNL